MDLPPRQPVERGQRVPEGELAVLLRRVVLVEEGTGEPELRFGAGSRGGLDLGLEVEELVPLRAVLELTIAVPPTRRRAVRRVVVSVTGHLPLKQRVEGVGDVRRFLVQQPGQCGSLAVVLEVLLQERGALGYEHKAVAQVVDLDLTAFVDDPQVADLLAGAGLLTAGLCRLMLSCGQAGAYDALRHRCGPFAAVAGDAVFLVQSHGSSCAMALRAASDRDAPTDLRS
jgi:hypothetical protein